MLSEELEACRASEENLTLQLERAVPLDEHAALMTKQRESQVTVQQLQGDVEAQWASISDLEKALKTEVSAKAALQACAPLLCRTVDDGNTIRMGCSGSEAAAALVLLLFQISLQAELNAVRHSYTPRPGWGNLVHTAERDSAAAHEIAAQRGVGGESAEGDSDGESKALKVPQHIQPLPPPTTVLASPPAPRARRRIYTPLCRRYPWKNLRRLTSPRCIPYFGPRAINYSRCPRR